MLRVVHAILSLFVASGICLVTLGVTLEPVARWWLNHCVVPGTSQTLCRAADFYWNSWWLVLPVAVAVVAALLVSIGSRRQPIQS